MFVTKYVDNEFYEASLSGKLKFGTLESYRQSEKGIDFRLTDSEERVSTAVAREDILNKSFTINGSRFKNCTIKSEGGDSIHIHESFNAHIYCLVNGPYEKSHHTVFSKHNENGLLCYVVFDKEKFVKATQALFKSIPFLKVGMMVAGKISYLPTKELELSFVQLSNYQTTPMRAVFGKPERFRYENEFRVAIPSNNRIVPLFTQNFSSELQSNFTNAIVGCGSL